MPEHERQGKRLCYTVALDKGIFGLTVAAVVAPLYIAALPFTTVHAVVTKKTELLEKNATGAILNTFYPLTWACSAFTCGEFGSYVVVETLHFNGLVSNSEHRNVMW